MNQRDASSTRTTQQATTTSDYDAAEAVASDKLEEVRWEKIEVAEQLGYSLDDTSVALLEAAADTYRGRLAEARDGGQHPVSRRTPATDEEVRVELIRTSEPHTSLRPGATGTVRLVDGAGTVHVPWVDGSSLGLIPGQSEWKALR